MKPNGIVITESLGGDYSSKSMTLYKSQMKKLDNMELTRRRLAQKLRNERLARKLTKGM